MRIEIVRGDITAQEVGAIVNAANSSLLGGGGVDGAIHRAAGPQLLEACRQLRRTSLPEGLPTGHAVATPGFDLPARWVIHTVGPNRHAGQTDPALLRSAFDSSLALAAQLECGSVAVPAISAGVYGWDADEVARIAIASARALAAQDDAGGAPVAPLDEGPAGKPVASDGGHAPAAGDDRHASTAGGHAPAREAVAGSGPLDAEAGPGGTSENTSGDALAVGDGRHAPVAGAGDGHEGTAGEPAGAASEPLALVRFVLFDERMERVFRAALG